MSRHKSKNWLKTLASVLGVASTSAFLSLPAWALSNSQQFLAQKPSGSGQTNPGRSNTPSQPATGGSGSSAPATGGSDSSTPATGGSDSSTPATGGADSSTPATGGAGSSTPGTGGSNSSTPSNSGGVRALW
jgi:hypothetical protein